MARYNRNATKVFTKRMVDAHYQDVNEFLADDDEDESPYEIIPGQSNTAHVHVNIKANTLVPAHLEQN
jgi:hypothetical protein